MPPPGHDDEPNSDDEVLVKRIKKVKQASKSRPKQIQIRSKTCAWAQADKERQVVQKSPKTPIKHGQLSVLQHEQQHKSTKTARASTTTLFKTPSLCNLCQNLERQTQNLKRYFRPECHHQDSFDPYPVTLYISPDNKIETAPMDVHLTLACPIGRRKVEEFYRKKPKMGRSQGLQNCQGGLQPAVGYLRVIYPSVRFSLWPVHCVLGTGLGPDCDRSHRSLRASPGFVVGRPSALGSPSCLTVALHQLNP
ncbi:hypothetical protein Cgig2_019374 [Carnegiea gigantea]|uniref:Uncharacterized protein n=1 Tax=Carnegiea gigantea TaxID=171969 RepID=A0A9Q1QHA6_9CARY|nr:hypothetical protein Cgig2_019374 [Carnegiea gigantea]